MILVELRGFEPLTSRMRSERSTAELQPPIGGDDGTRTHNLYYAIVALWPLSYIPQRETKWSALLKKRDKNITLSHPPKTSNIFPLENPNYTDGPAVGGGFREF